MQLKRCAIKTVCAIETMLEGHAIDTVCNRDVAVHIRERTIIFTYGVQRFYILLHPESHAIDLRFPQEVLNTK